MAGSSYALLEDKHDKCPALAFAAAWDSEESAREYFELYRRVLRGKWKTARDSAPDSRRELEGRGDSGYFRVWLDGATVNHLEGWKSPLH